MTSHHRHRLHAHAVAVLAVPLRDHVARLRRRRGREQRGDAGYATETVIVTALLVAAAITIIGIIIAKVLAKANAITM